MTDITKLTLKEARKALDEHTLSAEELSSAYIKKIEEKNTDVHAYLEVFKDIAEQASSCLRSLIAWLFYTDLLKILIFNKISL
jgi:aspartyl-tRNA(Asn)/glutamyl-tRNA(Gln) amidotransferase subunit A